MDDHDARELMCEAATGVALLIAVATFTTLFYRLIVAAIPFFQAGRAAAPLF